MTGEKTTKRGAGKKILVAAILGAVVGMLLAPKAGKELRQDLKKIMQKMEIEIIKQAGKTKKLTKEKYEEIVEAVVNSYAKARKIKKGDLNKVAKDLRKIWADVSRKLRTK